MGRVEAVIQVLCAQQGHTDTGSVGSESREGRGARCMGGDVGGREGMVGGTRDKY